MSAHLDPDPQTPTDSLLQPYPPLAGTFDELVAPDGGIRPHWQDLLGEFSALKETDRQHARTIATRMLRDDGLTYHSWQDGNQVSRPWQFDLFPLLISHTEWKHIEEGLIQRARLLNFVLGDLYGRQQLVKDGTLPPALVYGNPQFLQPCHGISVQGSTYLHFLAFDLARSPDGQWWVLRDRTEAPSGVGFALENRIIMSRSLPDMFAHNNVQRLSSFFQTFSDHLLECAQRDDPLAVVLSPGPHNATYFEHAYLARYLGFPVVEGSDLTSRDDRLFLKTVEGLKPVDLVLRRVQSDLCDPLELRTNSTIGVPGLLQAVRAGHVTIANALGSGLVESEGLLSFLPGLSQFFFGEALKMPSVATWWCGQAAERSHVLDNLDRLMIRRVLSPQQGVATNRLSFFGPDLSVNEKENLRRAILQNGHLYVGREIVAPSTTPYWSDRNTLQPAPMTLRIYLTASADGYRVMAGGLTRVSVQSDPRGHWHEPGDFSKDTWVHWDGPVDTPRFLAQPHHTVHLRRGGRDLPSRTADDLFWLGRYAERAEGAVRLLRSLVSRLTGESGPEGDPDTLHRLVSLLVLQEHLSQRRATRAAEGGAHAIQRELRAILFDPDSPDGLARVLNNLRSTAERIRERLSLDIWQTLSELTDIPKSFGKIQGQNLDDAIRLLSLMIQHLAALNGMVMENMTRSYAWRFLDMGRRLERVRHLSRLTRHLTTKGAPEEKGDLQLLLELADSSITYRTRYKSTPKLAPVLDLLLADGTNPRSVIFQFTQVETHISTLPEEQVSVIVTPASRILTRLGTELRLANMMELSEVNPKTELRYKLDRLVRQLDKGVHELSDIVASTYFSHSSPQRVSGPQWVKTQL